MPIKIGEISFERIKNLQIDEQQTLVEHQVAGLQGNIYQNLGRKPVSIHFNGVLLGSDGEEKMQKLRDAFSQGTALDFNSDVATPPGIKNVVIKDLSIREIAGRPQYYTYNIVLKEVIDLPENLTSLSDVDALSAVDTDVGIDANQFIDSLKDGLDSLQLAPEVMAVVDKLSPQISRLEELVKKLKSE